MCVEKWFWKQIVGRVRNCRTLHLQHLSLNLCNCLKRILCAERRLVLVFANDCSITRWFGITCVAVLRFEGNNYHCRHKSVRCSISCFDCGYFNRSSYIWNLDLRIVVSGSVLLHHTGATSRRNIFVGFRNPLFDYWNPIIIVIIRKFVWSNAYCQWFEEWFQFDPEWRESSNAVDV